MPTYTSNKIQVRMQYVLSISVKVVKGLDQEKQLVRKSAHLMV